MASPGYRASHEARGRVTSVIPVDEEVIVDHQMSADEATLVALGYKQEFKREFSVWTSFGVSFSVLGLLPSTASTLYYGLGYAGTGGMVWGWIIAMIFIQCVAMSMAELCSSMPTSGGLYYASAVLAPPGWGPLAAWLTGWSNYIVQVTGAPSVDYALSAMILSAASLNNPDYNVENYQIFLLTSFIMIIHGFISSMPTLYIARFNSVGTTMNILILFIVIVLIPAATINVPKFTDSATVWGTISNGTEWPDGIAVLMSFLSVIWTMSGYDAPFHLSEECSNANVASPRAIVLTSGVGGVLGWALQLVIAYTVTSIPDILDADQPWAGYCYQVLSSQAALAVIALTICCAFMMGQGCMVAASRVTYAYARDGCFPFSRFWARVNKTTQTPVNAVWFNVLVGEALLLLIFAGPVAIGALFSVGAIAAFVAFTIPIAIRVFVVGNRFRPGPWNLGKFSRPIGIAACSFVLLMLPILCFPAEVNPPAVDMNWTVVVYGAPMAIATLWYIIDAHKWFKGPKVNVEHRMLGDPGNVLEGKGTNSPESGSMNNVDAKNV